MKENIYKVIEYTFKKEIFYKELFKNNKNRVICAYKSITYINNKEKSAIEGICYLDQLYLLEKNENPNEYIIVSMLKKQIEELFKTTNSNVIGFEWDDYKIKNPYTYAQDNNDWGLYIIDYNDNLLLDYNGIELPKGIYFGYRQ